MPESRATSRKSQVAPFWRLASGVWRLVPWLPVLALTPVQAQITADGTMGTSVGRVGNAWSITAGTQRGGNLFHSFGRFNVNTGHSATFSGPANVTNIIGRVTGNDASNINGLLGSTIAGANLFLINPNGVMFGPGAQLDVSGSFHASTAHYLKLGVDGRFDALAPSASVLRSAAPSAFGFIGPPAAISVNGVQLIVPNGKGLSLVGGPISASVTDLVARGGRIDLAAVASSGEVSLVPAGTAASGITAYAPVTLDDTVVGTSSLPGYSPQGLSIRGGVLTLTGGSRILADTSEPGAAGGITIDASGPMTMSGGAIAARTSGAGDGGDIVVRSNGLAMTGGAFMETNTSGTGTGGNLLIDSSGAVHISGTSPFRTGLYASTNGPGDAGALNVGAPALTLDDGGYIHSHASAGRGADITIDVGRLVLSGGGKIESETQPFSAGAGGNIVVRATGDVTISGMTGDPGISDPESGIVTDGLNGSTARSGDLLLKARDVSITNGGLVATQMFDAAGGNVTLDVRRLTLASGGAVASDLFTGVAGGTLSIVATEALRVQAGGEIRSFSAVSGASGKISIDSPLVDVNAGTIQNTAITSTALNNSIRISAERLLISNDGNIVSRNDGGQGGGISVDARREIVLSGGVSTELATQVTGAGRAGDLTIVTPALIASGSARVSSEATGPGTGGNLVVRAGHIQLADDARISASTLGGIGGNVNVVATEAIHITSAPFIPEEGIIGIGGIHSDALISSERAGSVRITSPLVTVHNGHISTTTTGGGDAGRIVLDVGRLVVSGDGDVSAISQFGGGNGGSIRIRASEGILIGAPGRSVAAAIGTRVGSDSNGQAGPIHITTPEITLQGRAISSAGFGTNGAGDIRLDGLRTLSILDGGTLTTQADFFNGGNITINAKHLVYLRDSRITTSVGSFISPGDGGNITIDPTFVVLDNSQILANAFGGNGGNITIVSDFFLASPTSLVQASSQRGISGEINISAPNVDVAAGLSALPSAFFDASLLLRESCATRAGRSASSFTGVGRGGLPASPGQMAFGSYSDSLDTQATNDTGFTLASARVGNCR